MQTQDFNLYKNEVHAKFNDFEAGMEYARQQGKPVMIDFTGYGCVNCRKMELAVWTDPKVSKLLNEDYVLITLFVDDKTKTCGTESRSRKMVKNAPCVLSETNGATCNALNSEPTHSRSMF